MAQEFFADQTYTKVNTLAKADYECCSFIGCNFLNFDFSDFRFTECEFKDCDLSLVKLSKTILNDIKFTNCKLLGLHLEECNEFSLSFNFYNCILDHSSFYKRKIKKTIFKDTRLYEVDFTECDLSLAILDNCDLTRAAFDNTNLEKADLSASFNFSIDPEKNNIKLAKFSLTGLPGLLHRYNIEII